MTTFLQKTRLLTKSVKATLANSMKSFLENYEAFTSGNECPKVYHTWGGLAAISNLVSGRVWTDGGIYMVFPNMYIIFVGEPGAKKSTAMRLSHRVIAEFKKIAYAPASITKEALVQMMAKEDSPCKLAFRYQDKPVFFSHLSIFASELINLINAGGNPGGMIDFFTDVWDRCDSEFRETTKNKGDNTIVRPFISITGCMTNDTVKMLQSLKIISSGMTRRCLFIHGDLAEKPVAFPDVTEEQREAFKNLVALGVKLQNVCGEFAWENEARQKYEEFYHMVWQQKRKESSTILKQFLETKPEYVIKVAMLLWLSERTDSLVLTAENVVKSYNLVTSVEKGGALLFEGAGRNQLSAIAQGIYSAVLRQPKQMMPVKMVYHIFQKDATIDEIKKILEDEVVTERLSPILKLKELPGEWITTYENFQRMKKEIPTAKQ